MSRAYGEQVIELLHSFPLALDVAALWKQADAWEALASNLVSLDGQQLRPHMDVIYRAAHDVRILSCASIDSDRYLQSEADKLAKDLERLCVGTPTGTKRPSPTREYHDRKNRPLSSYLLSPPDSGSDSSPPLPPRRSICNVSGDHQAKAARLPLPKPETKTHQAKPNLDILREWFLHNLANPYPTPEEKEALAEEAGIPRSKVDSDLTNWRRRAGWTDIKDQWAGRDRKKMWQLIDRVEAGEEKRKAVVKAVEGVKSYLRREEEEKVGDWVHQLTGLITPKQETPRSVSNASHATSSSDESSNTSLSAVSRQVRASKRRAAKRSMSALSSISDTLPLSPETASSTKGFIFAPASSVALNNAMKRPLEPETEAEEPKKLAKIEHISPSAEVIVAQWAESPAEQGGNSMWSTNVQLPLLPHMTKEHAERWSMPESWEFRPALGVWSG